MGGENMLNGYFKEFIIKSESAVSGLVDDVGYAHSDSDYEDAKTSAEHLSDFIELTEWDPAMKESVRKLLSETREKINI